MKTGRPTDYQGAEAPPKRYALRAYNSTTEAIDQFERMARGFAPRVVGGDQITWVQDDTLTPDDRAWCWQTARQIQREAKLASVKRPKPERGIGALRVNRTRAEVEAMVARALARYPDANVNQIVVITGLQRPTVLKCETWAIVEMGRQAARS